MTVSKYQTIDPQKPYLFPIINGKWNGQILLNSAFWRNEVLFFWQRHDQHYQTKPRTSVKFRESASNVPPDR